MKNIKNQRFSKLLVIEESGIKNTSMHWICICDCGKKIIANGTQLRFGKIKSCGCISKLNLTNQKFGKLIALKALDERKSNHVVWSCKCECGTIVKVKSSDLTGNRKMSCGCYKPQSKDLIMRKFGKLTAIRPLEKRDHRYVVWKCMCDCGKTTEVKTGSLLSGKVRSCGCLIHRFGTNNPLWTGTGEISGKVWSDIKKGAKTRNLPFQITIEDAWKLFLAQNQKCALSNIELNFSRTCRTASLDRIDNSKGYIENNIQWIHKDINGMKHCFDQEYFIEMCKLIAKNK